MCILYVSSVSQSKQSAQYVSRQALEKLQWHQFLDAMNYKSHEQDNGLELRMQNSKHAIFQRHITQGKASLGCLTNWVRDAYILNCNFIYYKEFSCTNLCFIFASMSPIVNKLWNTLKIEFNLNLCIIFDKIYSLHSLLTNYKNTIHLYLKTQVMDYNINFEEDKGSYSPKSDPKDIQIQNVRLEKPEQDLSNPSPYGNFTSTENKSVTHVENKEPPSGCMKFCRLQFYEHYFQVSQTDVLERIKLAFIPIKTEFIQQLNDNPDFYGPFWLLTTIIFLVSSTGNLSRYFYNWTKDAYIFKLQLVRYAVLVLYSFGFGVPILLYFIMKFLGATKPSLPQMICLYGYSFSCFIPIFLLCIIPVQVLQWLLIAYGMINTSVFLIFNLKAYLSELEPPKVYLTFGLIVGAQVALFLTFKLVFFKMVYEEVPV